MNIIRRILHKHKWETFMDNIAGETGVTFTVACKQCAECGKYKIEFFYGSGKRLRNRLELQVSGQQLAEQFHKLYEKLAPNFGYETREETKIFNPESNNGKLMIAVSEQILK